MSPGESDSDMQDLEVTVWVGKAGIEAVKDELDSQLEDRQAVKVRILRSARGVDSAETVASELATAVDGEVADVRGHTAVITR